MPPRSTPASPRRPETEISDEPSREALRATLGVGTPRADAPVTISDPLGTEPSPNTYTAPDNEAIAFLPTLVPHASSRPPHANPAHAYLAGLAPSGRRSMAARLRAVAGLLGLPTIDAVPWEALRYPHVRAILARLADQGRAPASINTTLAALRGVASAAWNLGLLSVEDLERISRVKPVRGESLPAGRMVERDELRALLTDCAQDRTSAGRRDAALITLLFAAGLRRDELARAQIEDYDPAGAMLLVRHAKGRKPRRVPLAAGAMSALDAWLAIRGDRPGGLLLPINKGGRIAGDRLTAQSVYSALAKRAGRAGLSQSLSPHDLRRTFVSSLLDAGADIVTVQHLAGHAGVGTTARYDRRGEATQRRAVELLSIPLPADLP